MKTKKTRKINLSIKFILLSVIMIILFLPVNGLSVQIKSMKVIKTGTPGIHEDKIKSEWNRSSLEHGGDTGSFFTVDPYSVRRPVIVRVTYSCDKTPKKISYNDFETYQTKNKWGDWVTNTYEFKEIVQKKCGEKTDEQKQREQRDEMEKRKGWILYKIVGQWGGKKYYIDKNSVTISKENPYTLQYTEKCISEHPLDYCHPNERRVYQLDCNHKTKKEIQYYLVDNKGNKSSVTNFSSPSIYHIEPETNDEYLSNKLCMKVKEQVKKEIELERRLEGELTREWIYYGKDSNGDYYYDNQNRKIVRPNVIEVWDKFILTNEDTYKWFCNRENFLSCERLNNYVVLQEIDCNQRTIKIIKSSYYDDKGNLLGKSVYDIGVCTVRRARAGNLLGKSVYDIGEVREITGESKDKILLDKVCYK